MDGFLDQAQKVPKTAGEEERDRQGEPSHMTVTRRGVPWWHTWFLGLAQYVATASKDPSTQVGAVVVDSQRRIVSMGFNGFPRGVEDTPARLADRPTKLSLIVHAEVNALLSMPRGAGLVLYTWPLAPCSRCAGLVIQAGIRAVVAPRPPAALLERWETDLALAADMFEEAKVDLVVLE